MATRNELPEAELDDWYALAGDRDGERPMGTVAEGKVDGKMMNVLLSDCVLVRAN